MEYDFLYKFIEKHQDKIDLIKTQYLSLLSMLTVVDNNLTNEDFLNQVNKIINYGAIIICYEENIEDLPFLIIGSGTVFIEPKIIHGCSFVGHIEDIVVHENFRKKGISQCILEMLKTYCKEMECYKVILDCNDDVQSVYEKSGFIKKGSQMAIYFK
jgi:glucosamine-phosphate N-acetyltransferase